MASVVVNGDTSGAVTLSAPAVAGTVTVTLPSASGTMASLASVTANGVTYINSSSQPTSGSALTWSGTLLSATTSVAGNSNVLSLINSNTAGGGQGVAVSGFSSNGSNSLGSIQFGGAGSLGGNLDFYTANSGGTNTLNMRLGSDGNLLVGTTTANANFYVYGAPVSYAGLNTTAIFSSSASQSTGTGGLIAFEGKYTSGGALANFAAIGGLKENSTDNNYSGYLGFYTRLNGNLAAERARIDSSGSLLVGATSISGNVVEIYNNSNQAGRININKTTSGLFNAIANSYSGTYVGGVNYDNTTTSFPTSSDVRLKKDIVDAGSASAKIDQIRIVSHGWKHDDAVVEFGIVAQELVNVAPQAVSVGDDGEEIETTWGVDYSKLVPLLIKAHQEQQALITQLTARITAIEGAA